MEFEPGMLTPNRGTVNAPNHRSNARMIELPNCIYGLER